MSRNSRGESEGAQRVNDRRYEPWTSEEDQLLLAGYHSGLPPAALAERHGRTRGAVSSRLLHLGAITPRHRSR